MAQRLVRGRVGGKVGVQVSDDADSEDVAHLVWYSGLFGVAQADLGTNDGPARLDRIDLLVGGEGQLLAG